MIKQADAAERIWDSSGGTAEAEELRFDLTRRRYPEARHGSLGGQRTRRFWCGPKKAPRGEGRAALSQDRRGVHDIEGTGFGQRISPAGVLIDVFHRKLQ